MSRLKDKIRNFFSAVPQKCRYCVDGRRFIFDSKLTMDLVDIGECRTCKGTGLIH